MPKICQTAFSFFLKKKKAILWCEKKKLKDDRRFYFKEKRGTDCVRALQQPPPPFQKDWYFQTRCADFGRDLSHKHALRGNVGIICELVKKFPASLWPTHREKGPPNLPQNVVTFRSLWIQRQMNWLQIGFWPEKCNSLSNFSS